MRQNKTKQLLDYWLSLFWECNTPGSADQSPCWPDRRSIQPGHCRSLLSEMFILESHGGPYTYRLAGTNLCALYGRELKREEFSKAFIESDQGAAEDWVSRLTIDQQVVLICSVAELQTREKINLETLLLPLHNSSGSGNRILGITVPCDAGNFKQNGDILYQAIRSVRILHPWKAQSTSNRADNTPLTELNSPGASRRIDAVAPPLFPINDKVRSTIETKDSVLQYKRVGHLLVIDGGRDRETQND